MLIYHLWDLVAFTQGQYHKNQLSFVKYIWKFHIWKNNHISQPWSICFHHLWCRQWLPWYHAGPAIIKHIEAEIQWLPFCRQHFLIDFENCFILIQNSLKLVHRGWINNKASLIQIMSRGHFVYAPSQWGTTLDCNVVSHSLGAYILFQLKELRVLHFCLQFGHIDFTRVPCQVVLKLKATEFDLWCPEALTIHTLASVHKSQVT